MGHVLCFFFPGEMGLAAKGGVSNSGLGLLGKKVQISMRFLTVSVACKRLEIRLTH